MRNALRPSLTAWRRYRAEMAGSKTYKRLRWVATCGALAYILLLSVPQVLFAYEVSHGNIKVYSRQPIDRNIHAILDRVEGKLAASGVNDPDVRATNLHCRQPRALRLPQSIRRRQLVRQGLFRAARDKCLREQVGPRKRRGVPRCRCEQRKNVERSHRPRGHALPRQEETRVPEELDAAGVEARGLQRVCGGRDAARS